MSGSRTLRKLSPLLAVLLMLATENSCTRAGVSGRTQPAPAPAEPVSDEIPAEIKGEPALEEEEVYDIDDEILVEDTLQVQDEIIEELEQADEDTFTVKDLDVVPDTESGFDMGYRVQLLASSDLEKARDLKKKVMAGTGLAVYIDYEDGLYKVRAGDFPTREEASQARTMLVEKYPDCWIVKTTIRK